MVINRQHSITWSAGESVSRCKRGQYAVEIKQEGILSQHKLRIILVGKLSKHKGHLFKFFQVPNIVNLVNSKDIK